MKKKPPKEKKSVRGRYLLRLFITGATPHSKRALINVKRICEKHMQGRYDLEVIDIYQNPKAASKELLIAAPTLIKVLPKPLRRLIGDMSDEKKVLFGMDIKKI